MGWLSIDAQDQGIRLPGGLTPTDLYVPAFWVFCFILVLIKTGGQGGTAILLAKLIGLGGVPLVAYLLSGKSVPWLRYSVRVWFLAGSMAFGHDVVGDIITALHRPSYEGLLMRIDLAMVGGHVSQWAERVAWPPLIEYLHICYTSYFIVAIPLVYVLLHRREYLAINRYLTLMTFGLASTLVLYILVPARTPDTLFNQLGTAAPIVFNGPLEGLWLTGPIRHFFATATDNIYDAFPSGHTLMACLAALGALRHHRPTFKILFVWCLSIVISTLVLRYHYLIDVMAGLLFSIAVDQMEAAVSRWKQRSRFVRSLSLRT